MLLECNNDADNLVTVYDNENNTSQQVKATKTYGCWRSDNNRRIWISFKYKKIRYYGRSDETRTVFRAKAYKNQ